VILKPPELAPFSSARFAEICLEAGLPPGVLNVVPGGPEAGDALVRHPGVDKISFTGGLETARRVMSAAAENLTPVAMELGGKSANIIFPDADLSVAVPFAAMGAMIRTGQGCFLPTRLLVHESLYDDVVPRIVHIVRSLVAGDPSEESTQLGPVISAGHCARIQTAVERALAEKAGTLLTGGERLGGPLSDGFFLAPTVFGDVDNLSSLAQEEVFGPVLSILRFSDEEEAVALANGTRYGLGAFLWTKDLKRAHSMARLLRAGCVCVNGLAMPTNAPFGGVGASGFGREGGRAGIDEFLRPKNVYLQL
jgi:acyl-CoA reductase-like NAD-dependent aldehyde dehydrogenase